MPRITKGWKAALWKDVKVGQEVFIKGWRLHAPWAYGPHKVVDAEKRKLLNNKGQEFLSYPENLIVMEVANGNA